MTLWKCKRSVSDVFTMSYSGREIRGCFENKNTASLKPTKIRKGNYIRDDTAIQNNKDYLNQQHQQLVSTTCAAINSLPRSRNLM